MAAVSTDSKPGQSPSAQGHQLIWKQRDFSHGWCWLALTVNFMQPSTFYGETVEQVVVVISLVCGYIFCLVDKDGCRSLWVVPFPGQVVQGWKRTLAKQETVKKPTRALHGFCSRFLPSVPALTSLSDKTGT